MTTLLPTRRGCRQGDVTGQPCAISTGNFAAHHYVVRCNVAVPLAALLGRFLPRLGPPVADTGGLIYHGDPNHVRKNGIGARQRRNGADRASGLGRYVF